MSKIFNSSVDHYMIKIVSSCIDYLKICLLENLKQLVEVV